jgi:hypothetical protein
MTTHLEDELRATLHRQAARVPSDAVARITAHPYHPRTRRLRRPAAFGVTGAALAGGAGAAIALLGGAAPAFAGWTPQPTTPSAGQLATANSNCAARLSSQNLPLKLSDVRGPFTFEIYASDQASAACITGPSFTSASSMASSEPINVPADHLDLSALHATNGQGDSYSIADGRAGADVTGATLELSDGSHVTATVENGWFVAWWPSTAAVSSAQLTTSTGTSTQTFPALPAIPGAPGPGAHGGGSVQMGSSSGSGRGSVISSSGSFSGAGGPGTRTGTSTSSTTPGT